jgi:hypothetical protein
MGDDGSAFLVGIQRRPPDGLAVLLRADLFGGRLLVRRFGRLGLGRTSRRGRFLGGLFGSGHSLAPLGKVGRPVRTNVSFP